MTKMPRTPETAATFARDLQAVDDMAAGWWTNEAIEAARARQLVRHAEYDFRFDRMVAEVQSLDPRTQIYVRHLLERLGEPGCLSGSYNFGVTVEILAEKGITAASAIFGHDLKFIAATYLPLAIKEKA